MLAEYFKSPSRVIELQSRPGGGLLVEFAHALSRSGYSNNAGGCHLRAAEHFLYWAHREAISVNDFSDLTFDRFAAHLDGCQCYGLRRSSQVKTLYSVQLFLDIGVCLERTAPSVLDMEHSGNELFPAFCRWMRQYRGTSELTLYNYGNSLKSLLKVVGNDPSKLDALQLRQFILDQSHRKGSKAAQRCTTALRMFIRFLLSPV